MELHSSEIRSFKARELRSPLVLVLSLAIAFTASPSSQGLNFSIQAFNESVIKFEGDARPGPNNSIQLTEADKNQSSDKSVGWATYRQPMRLWDEATGKVVDFTTRFTFVINSLEEPIFADGMTFFLVPNGSLFPVDSLGGGLAIINPHRDPSNSSTWFVAVEFDTFYNDVSAMVVDPNCSQDAHISIDLNSLNSSVYECVDWFKDKIMNGGPINITITYNSSTQNLSVVMADANAMGTGLNSSAISDIVNLTKYFLEWVTLGFSAATVDLFELHTIEA